MKTRLNTIWFPILLLPLLGSLQITSAYYDPSAQRWVNRDPKLENGFQELRKTSLRGGTSMIDRNRRVGSKQNYENLHSFALNASPNRIDPHGLDAPGCDIIPDSWESACMLECCARHDQCYDEHGCSWLSWFCPFGECGGCNRDVVSCFGDCLAGYSDNPDMPNYYCSQCHEYFDLENPGDINDPQNNPHAGHHSP